MKRLKIWRTKLDTRKCNGCEDSSFHTHHLTILGRRRYLR